MRFYSDPGHDLASSIQQQADHNSDAIEPSSPLCSGELMERFFVQAGSVNQVRKALNRAPGGAQVIGRYDRQTIECSHTMSPQSFARHWPILLSRFEKVGLVVVDPPRLPDETLAVPEVFYQRTDRPLVCLNKTESADDVARLRAEPEFD